MNIFRSIVFAAILSGICAGLLVTALGAFGTTPLILAAEKYEQAGESADHAHDDGQAQAEHSHGDEEAWAPADGLERTLSTGVANILTAIGFALVLTGIFSLRNRSVGWREGLLFGLAGFVAVVLAPSLGLPPELPGTPAGDLAERQIWWIATVVFTACGLGLIAFVKQPWAAGVALLLFVLPHLYGAPLPPDGEHALAPEAMSHRFIVVSEMTGLVFWSALGVLCALFFTRFRGAEE